MLTVRTALAALHLETGSGNLLLRQPQRRLLRPAVMTLVCKLGCCCRCDFFMPDNVCWALLQCMHMQLNLAGPGPTHCA